MGFVFEKPELINQLGNISQRLSVLERVRYENKRTEVILGSSGENVDFTSLQDAIDYVSGKGGGTIFVRNGTYVFTSDINHASNVSVIGESLGGVVFVFAGNSRYSIQGSGAYETGTVSITRGSTTLTGSGTSWDGSVTTSHKIVLNGTPYEVSSVDSDTSITLSGSYYGPTLSGDSYYAAVMLQNYDMENIVMVGTSHVGVLLDMDYTDLQGFRYVIVKAAASNGIDMYRVHRPILETVITDSNGSIGLNALECPQINLTRMISTNNSSHGLYLDDVSELVCYSSPAQNNGGSGYYIKDSTKQTIFSSEGRGNTSHGFYLTGSSAINMVYGAAQDNGVDGIRIDANSDRNRVIGATLTDNTEYGIKIANANCDSNWLRDNDVSGNGTGGVSDSGTTTEASGNLT